jgi:hypothetical protein
VIGWSFRKGERVGVVEEEIEEGRERRKGSGSSPEDGPNDR